VDKKPAALIMPSSLTVRDVSRLRPPQRPTARQATSLDMTKWLFAALDIYHDITVHSAALNMAIDEALLEAATIPSIRFYRWNSPALSFGYFGRFTDVADYAGERDLVRRWTGGGIVFHGEDLTYSVVIPTRDPVFAESSMSIYEKIHRALAEALNGSGRRTELVGSARCADRTPQRGVPTNDCFANAVGADVMINGRKVAGAAQRRTHRGLLQQGSIQGIDLGNGLADRFALSLCPNCRKHKIGEEILRRSRELAECKYGTDSWLRKR
jgi:lipoate-protein ligase A